MGWLAARVSVGRRALRIAALSSLVATILIIIGGGVVRVTGSGLGCPDWPTCAGGAIAPTAELGWHGIIEFGNRLLTGALCVVVGWVIVVARLQREPVPAVTRWAWMQFFVVILNAVVGGITVLARLSPYIVAAHLLAAMLLLTSATVTWDKAQRLDMTRPGGSNSSARIRPLGSALLIATAVLVVVGTVVTGTGPHAGDSSEVARMPFSWTWVTLLHAGAAVVAFGVALALWRVARQERNTALSHQVLVYLIVFIGQGVVGIVQVVTHLPEVVVVLHLLGSALVWVGAVRILLAAQSSAENQTAKPYALSDTR